MATKADDAHKHALQLMGHLIPEGTQRDAVHIAVAPVVSDSDLMLAPGQPITFARTSDTEHVIATYMAGNPIGIVDPYLKTFVRKGDRFLMFLMPMSTTSLRHQWTHPAFGEEIPLKLTTLIESEAWLRRWADDHDVGYEELLCAGDASRHTGLQLNNTLEVPDNVWDHVEVVTGRKVKHRHEYFSCSC